MMHPKTDLRAVGPQLGLGVYATDALPKGTIVFVRDALDIVIQDHQYAVLSAPLQRQIDRYCYRENSGDRVVCWDLAKYVNHSCEANTMSCGWGFELAIRDIAAGEQITDEYGLLNLEAAMPCACGTIECRKRVSPTDIEQLESRWNWAVRSAVLRIAQVYQPLFQLLDTPVRQDLEGYLRGQRPYRSVGELHHRPAHPDASASGLG